MEAGVQVLLHGLQDSPMRGWGNLWLGSIHTSLLHFLGTPLHSLPCLVDFKQGGSLVISLGLKSAKDLSFGRREGFLARYERANALPARPRVGRARVRPFFPVPRALAAVAPPKGRQLGAKC